MTSKQAAKDLKPLYEAAKRIEAETAAGHFATTGSTELLNDLLATLPKAEKAIERLTKVFP
jgi:hypothetical protein